MKTICSKSVDNCFIWLIARIDQCGKIIALKVTVITIKPFVRARTYFASSSSTNFLIVKRLSERSSLAREKNFVSPYKETGS